MRDIYLLHSFATLMMCGVIWIIQWLHYPLFALLGAEEFHQYEILHRTWISQLVGPLMLLELGSAVLCLIYRPKSIPAYQPIAGILLLGVIWGSTFFIQVPLHNAVTKAFDPEAIRSLIDSNWIRTVSWSFRSVLSLLMLRAMMKNS
jgi:hypothetical protein